MNKPPPSRRIRIGLFATQLSPHHRYRMGALEYSAYPYLDISLRRSVTVRVYPGSLVAITDVTRGHDGVGDGVGDGAALALRVGKIRVEAEQASTCEVALTNGIVRISGGLACLYDRGDVDALGGSAVVTLKGQSEPSKVPQGYRFDATSGKLYELPNVH